MQNGNSRHKLHETQICFWLFRVPPASELAVSEMRGNIQHFKNGCRDWVYVERHLSGTQNRALLARDSNTCDLSQKSHTRCNCKAFFSGLSTRAEGPAVALHHLFQVWAVPSGFKNPGVESAG